MTRSLEMPVPSTYFKLDPERNLAGEQIADLLRGDYKTTTYLINTSAGLQHTNVQYMNRVSWLFCPPVVMPP